MVEATPSTICRCKVLKNRIVFCALHESAHGLLATCEHLRKFLSSLKVAAQRDENMIRQLIFPYLDRQIAGRKRRAASSHFSQRDYIEGCKRREYFHLDDPGGSALLSRRQTGNWTPMAAIRLCTSQCPIRRRCYSLVADSADNPQISAA